MTSRQRLEQEFAALRQQFRQAISEKGWSERKMQSATGLHRRCWRRIQSGELTGRKAVLKLRAALAKLNPS